MRRKIALILTAALLGLAVCLPAAAAGAGTSDDPLVTLSYLNETFLAAVQKRIDEAVASRNASLTAYIDGKLGSGGGSAGTASSFAVVTIPAGKTLVGDIGCEVMLRVGTASCVSPSSPGLIDETTAGTLNNAGALVTNHLYMMTIEGRGVKAGSATTKLLVRGSYTVA